MKNLILLNRSGMGPDVMSRKGRHSLDPILSRLCLASLICLCMLTIGSGNVWGAILYNDNFGNVGSNGNSYTTRTGWTLSNTYAHYNSGIRLGTSGGYATKSGMSSIVGTKDIQVTVYVAKWNNDASSLVVTVNGTAKIDGNSSKTFSSIVKTTSTGGAVTWNSSYLISFIVTGATSSTTIKFGTNASGSRAILGPIRISDPAEDCGVFYESWDKCTGTGGNNGSWSGSIATGTLTADNTGWTVANGNGASKCAKFGTGSNKGSAQTPAITYTGSNNLVLTFKAGAWNGGSEGTTLNLSATNATLDKSSVTLTKGAWTTYTVNITSITSGFKIKWEAKNASNNRFFLDDICISENITPSCDAPTGLTNGAHQDATTGNNGSQVVSWSGSAANYDVCVNASNSVPTSETSPDHTGSATSYTISGKNPGNYRWWVRSNCGGEKSDWVEGTSFTIKGIKTGGTIPVAFGTVGQGCTVAAKTITVTGIGLSSGTSITAAFPSGSPFSVDPTSVNYNANSESLSISASTATVGAYDQNLTLSYGGTYTATVKVTMTVVAADRFIDVLQNTSGYEAATPHIETGTYSTPTLADKSVATSGTCEEQHYHFVGWITAAKYAAGTTITDGDLQTPITASNATYYAVWAKQGTGGGGSSTETLTGAEIASHFTSSAVAYGDAEKSYTDGDITWAARFNANAGVPWFQLKSDNAVYLKITAPAAITKLDMNVSNTSCSGAGCTMNMSAHGYSGSNISLNTAADGSGTTVANASPASSYAFSLSPTGSNSTLYLKVSGATRIWADITVTYSGGVSYTDYLAKCCDNMVAAPTVSATNIHYNQFTLSWTNVTGADSYNVTCTGGTPGAIQSDGTTRTCTITGLASPNTSYSWTVVATYSGTYCGATPAAGSTTTAQVYAVEYNANGGTVSPLPSTVSYEAGVTVTVAAEPGSTSKSGCTFTGWNTQNDGQGTHYAASGSATFTMPSSAVTLYAEWTKKKNYYVDRMHGTNDGHTVTIGDVVYNCYLREGANYTVPTIGDNTSGASACHSEHDHLLFWVTESSVNDDGTLKGGYTEVTPGDTKTAQSDGTIYYAIWGKLAD